MSTPYYKVNGTDMIPYLIEGGLTWSEEDIDGEDSGRTMDGIMQRELVARKDKNTLSFRALTQSEIRTVTAAFNSTYVTIVTNFHPKTDGTVTKIMYNSSRKAAVFYLDEDGNATWKMDDISIIER